MQKICRYVDIIQYLLQFLQSVHIAVKGFIVMPVLCYVLQVWWWWLWWWWWWPPGPWLPHHHPRLPQRDRGKPCIRLRHQGLAHVLRNRNVSSKVACIELVRAWNRVEIILVGSTRCRAPPSSPSACPRPTSASCSRSPSPCPCWWAPCWCISKQRSVDIIEHQGPTEGSKSLRKPLL